MRRPEILYNFVNPPRDEVACYAEADQASCDPEEPLQIAFVFLTGHPYVHAPETSDDVHGEHDCTQNSEAAKYVSCLLLSFVHTDVDLGEVVAMSSRQDSR